MDIIFGKKISENSYVDRILNEDFRHNVKKDCKKK